LDYDSLKATSFEKHEVPSTTKKIPKGFEACEVRSGDVFAEEIQNNVSDNEVSVSEDIDFMFLQWLFVKIS